MNFLNLYKVYKVSNVSYVNLIKKKIKEDIKKKTQILKVQNAKNIKKN